MDVGGSAVEYAIGEWALFGGGGGGGGYGGGFGCAAAHGCVLEWNRIKRVMWIG